MHESPRVQLLLVLLGVLVASPSSATPIIFTDRAAFDAFVGSPTLVNLNNVTQVTFGPPLSPTAGITTFDNLMNFFWEVSPQFVGGSPIALGAASLPAAGWTLVPVTAFGFTVVGAVQNPGNPPGPVFANVGGLIFSVKNGDFIGLVDSTPFFGGVSTSNAGGNPGGLIGMFFIDNIALQLVPEPSSLLLLACGIGLLIVWRFGRDRLQRNLAPH